MEKFFQHPVDHNPSWPLEFLEVSEEITSIMDKHLLKLHHIGSTAIPNLMAKPIIDILGVTGDFEKISSYKVQMQSRGFEFKGEFGISQRAYFSRSQGIAVHLHIFPENHSQVTKHLLFRDYLLMHPEAVRAYQAKKEELLRLSPQSREVYQQGKEDLINQIMEAAYNWNSNSGTR